MPGLKRTIGLPGGIAIVAGSIIGSGIFMKPATMAAQLASPIWMTLVWIIAGIFSLIGALILAELGAWMPETGGLYTHFRKIYGNFFGFLYGWAAFAVTNTAAVAAISFICARYLNYFLHIPGFDAATEISIRWHIPFLGDLYPLQDFGTKMLAMTIVIVVAGLNYISIKGGERFQRFFTWIKIGIISLLILGIFFSGNGSVENFVRAENPKQGWNLLSAVIAAMTGAFFAYDGWINITYVAGEIKEPQKNIPRSTITGIFICIALYVLVTQAYLYVLPVEKMASSELIAADAIGIAFGTTGASIIAALIVISTLGAVNGNQLCCARVTYAMGQHKSFIPWAGKTHKRFNTPANALLLHALLSCIFILTGSFDILTDMFIFIAWLAFLFGAIAIFILHKKVPASERPYKVWGYPWVPALFIAFTIFYLVVTIWNDVYNYLNGNQPVINSLLGLAITSLGMPLYFYFRSKNKEDGEDRHLR